MTEHLIKEINLDDKIIYLLGTAHVSKKSVEQVRESIESLKPDTIAVELCDARAEALNNPEQWKKTDLFEIIRNHRLMFLFGQLFLSSFQKRIGDQIGVKPGQEMVQAIKSAEEQEAQIAYIDRPINITLQRAWSRLGWWTSIKLIASGFASLFESGEEIDEETIEDLKGQDMLEDAIEELGNELPEIKEVIIHERDQYMAEKLRHTPGHKILAVIGAGHLAGIQEEIKQEHDLEALSKIPKPNPLAKFIPWLLPLMIIGLFIYIWQTAGAEQFTQVLESWFLFNAGLGGLGALLALPHPLTVLSAALACPFTSLNPLVAGGWVAGLTEAYFNPPTVADFESIQDDITKPSAYWSNKVLKLILVVALTNLGSSLGTYLAGLEMVQSIL